MRRKPVDVAPAYHPEPTRSVPLQAYPTQTTEHSVPPLPAQDDKTSDKPKFSDRMRNIFGSMFD
ncbi:cell division protein FtsA C-terminal domain-containing protein [Streptococcus plurextorum]|uniref:cell division protein FtsA C-terminal domain-containing protein n=1 Tax=Streptococcus plurextorum TaxID=456876 RepID=UPI003CCBE1B2